MAYSSTMPVYENKIETLNSWYTKWAGSLSTHRFFTLLVLGQSNSLYSLLSLFFKMAPERAKWNNHVHSYMSGTQGVNTAFCTGPQSMVPRHQVHVVSPLMKFS